MNMKVKILLFFVISLLSNISVTSCCHDNERSALLSFKSELADPSIWFSSWQGQNCCSWHGIRCSETFHVIAVDLPNPSPDSFMVNMNSEVVPIFNSTSSALTGTIHPSLFTLSHIKYLDLSFNNFRFSRIPAGIANLTRLTYLNLSNAMFSGSITNQFSNLTSLRWLDLSCSMTVSDFSSISYDLSSQLTLGAVPGYTYMHNGHLSSSNLEWLKGMHNLKKLFLTGVDLSETSKFTQWANPISGLFSLRILVLSNCTILGQIPTSQLLNLTHLSGLGMDFNSFTSRIPVHLANLTSLSAVDFTSSNLRGPIPYLPQLVHLYVGKNNLTVDLELMFAVPWPQLEVLDIGSALVTGPIPASFANTTSLVDFLAYDCSIESHIPSSMTNLSKLERLYLDLNRLVGELPSSISNLKSLKVLSLMQNSLHGSLPESICNISSLTNIALSTNNFSGEIPDCFNNFPNLEVLFLTSNSFTGTIQSLSSFFKTSSPYLLGLGNNKLTVKLDQHLPSSFQPSVLELSSCNIAGGIPNFLSNLTKLSFLMLLHNNLSGAIPHWLFNLPMLSYLDLSFNNLQGFLPSTIRLKSFYAPATLNLANNVLEGPIPSLLENIDAINLSGNNFTGNIPPQVALAKRRYISFSGNKLVGQIPSSFCQADNALMFLDLSNNSLSGPLPASLGNCTSLYFLDVATNNFSCTVPKVLKNAKSLSYLDLTGNQFKGLFPTLIAYLQDLVVLKMGYNKFVGKIPRFVGNLRNLRILILKSNFFNGSIPKEINKLGKLQIMDFSNNKLFGPIPKKLDGLKTLIDRPTDGDLLGYVISAIYTGVQLNLAYKGLIYQYDVVRTFHSGIDLSLNDLTGIIPQEMTLLKGLAMLNLSHNAISGRIPGNIGDLVGLQSLDLSFNNLSGEIPASINSLDSLGAMKLSYNNLSGRIPTGTRFDTLYDNGWTYTGNKYLCGSPDAIINCNNDYDSSSVQETVSGEDARERLLFIGVVTLGYIVGFWGYLGFVILKIKWKGEALRIHR